MFVSLAIKSLLSRKGSVVLTLFSLSISIFILLAVEHIRNQAKESFSDTVSGVDLIVGARTGSLNLLLYSVFHVGSPTNDIDRSSYQALANNPDVDWLIPIALGDSHRGYRVVGTNQALFEHFSYGPKHALVFKEGQGFQQTFDVVLGHDVALNLAYVLGDEIVVAHGLGQTSFKRHDANPFTVTGILAPTGTPIDQGLYISLQGLQAIHSAGEHKNNMLPDYKGEQGFAGHSVGQAFPKSVTAVMLGLRSKLSSFKLQRQINRFEPEPLTAILPGVALMELWQMLSVLEDVLRLIAFFVLLASLLGMSAMLMSAVRERAPEMHLLRMIGASPRFLFCLIQLDALLLCLCSILVAVFALYGLSYLSRDWLASEYGLFIDGELLNGQTLILLATVLVMTLLASLLPAILGYVRSK